MEFIIIFYKTWMPANTVCGGKLEINKAGVMFLTVFYYVYLR